MHSPRTSFVVRLLVATWLFAMMTASWSQETTPAQATEEAFDALLSLPQGLPERSEFAVGSGSGSGARITDEATLRVALEEDLSAGADLDAYRHGGTLLLHALRANLQDTALWLLAHGADPRLAVDDGQGMVMDKGDDALQLAILYRRWRVVDALLRRHAVAPHTPRDLAFRWIGLFDARAPDAADDAAARELARRLAWPDRWYGGCLLAAAQDRLLLPMLMKTSARTAVRRTRAEQGALKGRDAQIAAFCPESDARFRSNHVAGRFVTFKGAELAKADARMTTPILQLLAAHLDTPADVRAWATLPLRRPWQDTAFARAVVQAFLLSNAPQLRSDELRIVPPAALHAALDDDVTLDAWFAMLGALPPPQAIAALAEIDDATLRRHPEAVVSGLAGVDMRPGGPPRTQYPNPSPALWSAVLDRLPVPLRLGPSIPASTYMTQKSWAALFSRGYRPTAAELLKHLEFATTTDWPAQWAQLRANATPETITETLRLALARWTKPCAGDYVAPQLAGVQALALMAASGAPLPPPVTLSGRCVRLANPEALQALLDTRLATLPPGERVPVPPATPEDPAGVVVHGSFVLAPRVCPQEPAEAIVRAAIHDKFLVDGNQSPQEQAHPPRPEAFEAIDEPGASACAWLVTGGVGSYREITDENTFFEGHYFVNPCVEPTLVAEVWHVVDDRVVASTASLRNEEGALQLKESDGGRRFVLTLPVRSAGCDGGNHAELFTWTGDAANPVLMGLGGDKIPARDAYDRQCPDDDGAAACFGLMSEEALVPWQGQSAEDFVAQNGSAQRQRWIAAFLANDVEALKTADVFPSWRAEALIALNESALPLADKRHRIAWMFRDKAGLAESFGSGADYRVADRMTQALVGLVAWLPREDWRPLLAVQDKRTFQLQPLIDAAQAKGDATLACSFARAAGEACEAAPKR